MKPLSLLAAPLAALLLYSLPSPAGAISSGQVDDFQDATLQGWNSGGQGGNPNPNPPLVGPICGPGGGCGPSLDHYAILTGNGSPPAPPPAGAGRAVVASNALQWSGDYLGAGVTSIQLDVNNLGTTDLILRLSMLSLDPSGGTFSLTNGIPLPAHGTGEAGWTRVVFDISADSWTAVAGPGGGFMGMDIATTLSNVAALRIVSSAAPSFQGDSQAGQLGIDNISAVPEPGTLWLVLAGLGCLGWRRTRS